MAEVKRGKFCLKFSQQIEISIRYSGPDPGDSRFDKEGLFSFLSCCFSSPNGFPHMEFHISTMPRGSGTYKVLSNISSLPTSGLVSILAR